MDSGSSHRNKSRKRRQTQMGHVWCGEENKSRLYCIINQQRASSSKLIGSNELVENSSYEARQMLGIVLVRAHDHTHARGAE